MIRIVEILVAINALCGIAAFLIARKAIHRTRQMLGIGEEEEERRKELGP